MPNVLDRIVGFFNPETGLRRVRSRELLTRAYEGASKRDGWRPKRAGASANTDHQADAATLRVRARALTQNVPYIAQGMRSLTANIIGTGITPRWTEKGGEKLDALWAKWAKVADADGRLDVYGLQAAAYRAMVQDGEVMIRIRTRRASDGLPVPLQFQLLEIDWLDSSRTERRGGNAIINGIEYDPLGKVAGYWLFDQHPGEVHAVSLRRSSSYFVPAASIIHLFNPERPGQGRGFTRLAPVIASVRDLQVYMDAEIQRKNLESRLSVIASLSPDMLTTSPETTQADPGNLGQLAGGGIIQAPPGMNLTTVEPKAAPGYTEYVKLHLHIIAAGWGVTYEMMTGDVSEVNFSSARVRNLDFRREAEVEQWTVIIPTLCQRMCDAFANACELAGLVPTALYEVEHATPKWDYVNPQQDVEADLKEVSGGLSSISEKLRRRGYKPDAVFRELADDVKKLKDLGLLDVLFMLQKGRMAEAAPAAQSATQK